MEHTDFVWKPHVPMEHSGASNCSLKEDMEAMLYILVSTGGHLNPNDVNLYQPQTHSLSLHGPWHMRSQPTPQCAQGRPNIHGHNLQEVDPNPDGAQVDATASGKDKQRQHNT